MENRRVLLTGASGFLGHWLLSEHAKKLRFVAAHLEHSLDEGPYDCTRLDLRDASECEAKVASFRPDVIVHAAAMSNTTECERNPLLAQSVNVTGTSNLLNAASRIRPNPYFVYISTDLVFDGTRGGYVESDAANPIQVYGRSKLTAEQLLTDYAGDWCILRSSLIYGPQIGGRECFLQWMVRDMLRGEVSLFTDEFRTPVYVSDLNSAVCKVIEQRSRGVFHIAGAARISRYDFGLLAAKELSLPADRVLPVSTANLQVQAPRPADVSLNIGKARRELGYKPRSYTECLARVLRAS